jgi:hypothetical protein
MAGEVLESKKFHLALAVAHGHSIAAWADTNQVPQSTAFRWARGPKFRAHVAKTRQSVLDQAVGVMTRNATAAAERIVQLGETAESDSVKLRALRAILSDPIAVNQYNRLEDRLAELEEQFDAKERAGSTRSEGQPSSSQSTAP